MGRLKSLQPRVKALGSRLQPAMTRDESEAKRYRDRDAQQAWRKLYKTERWRKLRLKVLERDGYTCQKTGVICVGRYPAPHSPVVDHIKPHHGDERLFWDESNLHTVTKEYHDKVKQSEERAQPGW